MGQWQPGSRFPNDLGTERNWLPFVLAGAGIFIAISSVMSIKAADNALRNLLHDWEVLVRNDPYKGIADMYFPGIAAGGGRLNERFGKSATMTIPVIISVGWLCVIIMFAWDKYKDPNNAIGPARGNLCQVELTIKLTDADKLAKITCDKYEVEELQKQVPNYPVTIAMPAVPKDLPPNVAPGVSIQFR